MTIQHKTASGGSLSIFLMITATLFFIGCAAVGPDYAKPKTNTPAAWNSLSQNALIEESNNPEALAKWWTTFNDSELTSLTLRAINGNLDLKKAQSRIREARAQRNVAAADLFPTLNFSGSDTYSRKKATNALGATGDKYTSNFDNLYSGKFDAGWELDIFGGVRRSIEASQADLQASREDLRNVLVSLIGELALNYVDVRTYQERIVTVEKNLKAQEETYQLTQWRNQAGLSDELGVAQANSNLESTRSQLPSLHTGLEAAMNRIAILLGEQPGKLHEELKQKGSVPKTPEKIAVGVPADIIRRRPDIRKAERNLAAETARIGEATAELYPKFSLNGSIGIDALSIKSLGEKASKMDNYGISGGPQISWAIFKGGAIRQNIKVRSALQEQVLISYESTILTALEDVENALVSYSDEQQKSDSLNKAAAAAAQASELAEQKYSAGLTDFTDVLDAQRSLLSLQDQLNQSRGNILSDIIRLYKALGGGWENFDSNTNQITLAGEGK